jgi:Caenorhabditis protein of unknown function, DUF268
MRGLSRLSSVSGMKRVRRGRRARADFETFRRAAEADPRFRPSWSDARLYLDDATQEAGFDRHYTYHVAWAARVLAETRPESHTDISSLLYFSVILSAFVPVRFYDYRDVPLELEGVDVGHADLLDLPFLSRSERSLSCMHVLEHIGLGRYGDPIDPRADTAAMRELERVLAPGGDLLVVVPVGRPRVVFNAHRVYAYDQLVGSFPELVLVEFALIPGAPERGHLLRNAPPELVQEETYGCGCFWFRRPEASA